MIQSKTEEQEQKLMRCKCIIEALHHNAPWSWMEEAWSSSSSSIKISSPFLSFLITHFGAGWFFIFFEAEAGAEDFHKRVGGGLTSGTSSSKELVALLGFLISSCSISFSSWLPSWLSSWLSNSSKSKYLEVLIYVNTSFIFSIVDEQSFFSV